MSDKHKKFKEKMKKIVEQIDINNFNVNEFSISNKPTDINIRNVRYIDYDSISNRLLLKNKIGNLISTINFLPYDDLVLDIEVKKRNAREITIKIILQYRGKGKKSPLRDEIFIRGKIIKSDDLSFLWK